MKTPDITSIMAVNIHLTEENARLKNEIAFLEASIEELRRILEGVIENAND